MGDELFGSDVQYQSGSAAYTSMNAQKINFPKVVPTLKKCNAFSSGSYSEYYKLKLLDVPSFTITCNYNKSLFDTFNTYKNVSAGSLVNFKVITIADSGSTLNQGNAFVIGCDKSDYDYNNGDIATMVITLQPSGSWS